MTKLGTASGAVDSVRSALALAVQAERAQVAAKRTAIEQRALRKARAQTLERWHHKNAGTPETHEAHRRQRPGAIVRLHASGYLDDDELAYAEQIAAIAYRIMADVTVRTASLETRIDGSRHGDAFFEALGAVWNEMAYSRWRTAIGPANAKLVLDIIVRDVGVARAAVLHGVHVRRARRMLTDALALWAQTHRTVRDEVTPADLAAAHVGLI
ncbi:hypothetical protein IWY39_000575 [Sphingobium sp. JAI105]|uniref:hypothetical protein n=1 Tax=Sphingobium sp. JAI105 TaxID=2787715 RepID=UPI001A18820B|nr:hypothetical protein [Sphingobium sp. JAI105]MBG6116771.1 hypothetical protein [Sphingobium sp. JAI105]